MEKFKAARLYENNLDIEKRKKTGIYYTPAEIVEYIVDNTVGKLDVLKIHVLKFWIHHVDVGIFLCMHFIDCLKFLRENLMN